MAMNLLTRADKRGVLPLNDETVKQLKDKHPKGKKAGNDVLLQSELPETVNPVIFAPLNGILIKRRSCRHFTRRRQAMAQHGDFLWFSFKRSL